MRDKDEGLVIKNGLGIMPIIIKKSAVFEANNGTKGFTTNNAALGASIKDN